MDGATIATVAGVGSAIIIAVVAGSVKTWRAIGRLEGKMDGLDSEAFGRLEGKVGALDKRICSYELQLTGFNQKIAQVHQRLNGFVDVLIGKTTKKRRKKTE